MVTGNRARADAARRSYPEARIEATAEGLFERAGEHDLVVVASPNDAHAELAARAIDAGLAVVVDKPLAPTSATAAALVERAERAGTPLTVFHNRRWDSDQLTLRRLIDAGTLGEVLRYESRFERWRPVPKAGSWRQATPPERWRRTAARPRDPSRRPSPGPVRAGALGEWRGRSPSRRSGG